MNDCLTHQEPFPAWPEEFDEALKDDVAPGTKVRRFPFPLNYDQDQVFSACQPWWSLVLGRVGWWNPALLNGWLRGCGMI